MDIHTIPSQFELFPSTATKQSARGKKISLFTHVTVTPENLIVFSIIFVMIVLLCFSLGVERGKRVMRAPQPAVVDVGSLDSEPVEQLPVAAQAPSSPVQVDPTDIAIPEQPSIGGGDTFTVQVASFKQLKSAKRAADALKDNGHEAFVMPKGNYSIVCVGKFSGQAEAKKVANTLKKRRYNDCLIRRL